MATNIGSILAQSGATTGQLMGGGIADLGAGLSSGIGGMLTRRKEREQKERQRQTAALVASGQQMEDQATALAEQRRKGLLTKQAIQLAQRDGDTASLQAIGVGALDPAEYLKSRATAKEKEGFTLPAGSSRFEPDPTDPTKFIQVAVAPFKEEKEKPVDQAFELAKTGKYTASSIQDAVQEDGSIDYSKLQEVVKSEGRGNVGSNVENRNNEISAESTKASIGLARNRKLQQELLANPNKTAGILSDLRTSVLDIAGKRDDEEEAKTAFLRTRNTDIINSLPPGVASDTDVRIFSQGFPAANASADEILRYLQAEERILAASSDMALVADRHLASQINAGLDATMVGFEDKKQRYASIMQQARKDIEEKVANAQTEQEAIEAEREIIRQVSEVLGFVPKFYR